MLKSKLWLFFVLVLSSTASFAVNIAERDECVHEGVQFRRRYWDNLKNSQEPFSLRTFTTDDDESFAIRHETIDRKFENTIRYNVILPEYLIKDEENYKPRGVIIKVYGAGIKEELNENPLSEERIYASQGYIVYTLNLRGTKDYGEEYVNYVKAAHGVQSLVRDITYFANLIKTGTGDIDGQRPAFARLVKPGDSIFLTGASYGGYLALHHATNPEENLRFYPTRDAKNYLTVPHKGCIDGYIPHSCHSNIFYDLKSQTTAGLARAEFFYSKEKGDNWIGNTYQNHDIFVPKENAVLSPTDHASYVTAPIWLVHGLDDDNNSPKHTVKFWEAAFQSQRGQFVGTSYAPLLGHEPPYEVHSAQAYYEPILQFMDNVHYTKKHGEVGEVFTFDRSQQLATAKINKAAKFRMRAHHPTTLARPQERLLNKIAVRYMRQYDIKPDQTINPEHLSRSFHALIEDYPQEFLKAVLYLHRKQKFKTKGTFGPQTLTTLKDRRAAYEYDLKHLDIYSIRGKLYPYMNSKLDDVVITQTIPGTPWWNGYEWITPPPCTQHKTISSTPYTELKRHLGNGDTRLGSEIFKYQKERLKTMFVDLLTMCPKDRPLYFNKVNQISTPFP